MDKRYWVIAGLFLGLYYSIVADKICGVPRWDDYDAFLRFPAEFIDADTWGERFRLLMAQHVVHRILSVRLIALCMYWISGKVSIMALAVAGNLYMAGLTALLSVFGRSRKNLSLFVLVAVMLIFNGQNYETSAWAMAGVANAGILLLAGLSVWLTCRSGCFVAGTALSVLTAFSNGNGMCIFPAVSAALWLQKRRRESIIYASVGILSIVGYFYHLDAGAVGGALSHPIASLGTFLDFAGNNLWSPLRLTSLLTGAVVVGTYIAAFWKKDYRRRAEWFAMFTFLLLTAGMLSFGRAESGGGALRYRIYGSACLVLTALYWLDRKPGLKKIGVPVIALYSLFSTLIYIERAEDRRQWLLLQTALPAAGVSYEELGIDRIMVEDMRKASSAGFFKMPETGLEELRSHTEEAVWQDRQSAIRFDIELIKKYGKYYIIRGWAYTETAGMDFTDINLYLIGDYGCIETSTNSERRYDIEGVSQRVHENCGFCAILSEEDIPDGEYEIGIEIGRRLTVALPERYSIETGKRWHFY